MGAITKLFVICLFVYAAESVVLPPNYRPQQYDNLNTDAIVTNDRILLSYYKCVMDRGPCNKAGKGFKKDLPVAIATSCEQCSTLQKMLVKTLLLAIRSKSQARFDELIEKYDPEMLYRENIYRFVFGQ